MRAECGVARCGKTFPLALPHLARPHYARPMFLPIRTDVPLRRTPWVNWGLIVANLLVFIAQLARPALTDRLALDSAAPHLWQYVSYAFLHSPDGFLHIVGNMLFLYLFGNAVNSKMGDAGYLAFYLAGGVVAGIAHVVGAGGSVIGASGAVSAVTGAYMVLFPRARVTVLVFLFLIFTYEVPGAVLIVAFFALDVFQQLLPGLFGGTHVAYLAHIGGTVFGAAVSFALLAGHLLPRDQFDAVALFRQWNRRRVYRDQVNRGWNPYGGEGGGVFGVGREKPNRADPTMERVQDLRAGIAAAVSHDKLPEAAALYLQLHALDPDQVLSRQNQLDVANQLFVEQQHAEAADAYGQFLRYYPRADRIEQVHLMLGLTAARYLRRPDLARTHLTAALEKLDNPAERDVAQAELDQLAAPAGRGG